MARSCFPGPVGIQREFLFPLLPSVERADARGNWLLSLKPAMDREMGPCSCTGPVAQHLQDTTARVFFLTYEE